MKYILTLLILISCSKDKKIILKRWSSEELNHFNRECKYIKQCFKFKEYEVRYIPEDERLSYNFVCILSNGKKKAPKRIAKWLYSEEEIGWFSTSFKEKKYVKPYFFRNITSLCHAKEEIGEYSIEYRKEWKKIIDSRNKSANL